MSRVPLFQKKRVMEGRRRKYTPPGSEYDIPTRTRRLRQSSIRKLQSEANFSFVVTPYLEHQLKMSYILTQQNLDQDSSDHNTDSGSEDTHDDGGGGMTNLDQDSFDNRSENGSLILTLNPLAVEKNFPWKTALTSLQMNNYISE
ncbi:uncharacterized protein LOC124879195 isoform X4 [Girardinichthys multiradiatus]|uniref:uncharacterized protein LOC124879195 isoform X4 n=1 Tax=Girardinichthys multiradiatus TaxID=208333 RepID=UPI001FAB4827|nr:uncharacterized protein LOC124879195 isoform X4 [Girardinichthys multiradiatus]